MANTLFKPLQSPTPSLVAETFNLQSASCNPPRLIHSSLYSILYTPNLTLELHLPYLYLVNTHVEMCVTSALRCIALTLSMTSIPPD